MGEELVVDITQDGRVVLYEIFEEIFSRRENNIS